MNLHRLLQDRVERAGPIRVGIIGAGKFATMFLAQARVTPGLHIMGIADLDPARGTVALNAAGWPAEAGTATSLADALRAGPPRPARRRASPMPWRPAPLISPTMPRC
jgi:predicted homoserine dehydrogenase-like protein